MAGVGPIVATKGGDLFVASVSYKAVDVDSPKRRGLAVFNVQSFELLQQIETATTGTIYLSPDGHRLVIRRGRHLMVYRITE